MREPQPFIIPNQIFTVTFTLIPQEIQINDQPATVSWVRSVSSESQHFFQIRTDLGDVTIRYVMRPNQITFISSAPCRLEFIFVIDSYQNNQYLMKYGHEGVRMEFLQSHTYQFGHFFDGSLGFKCVTAIGVALDSWYYPDVIDYDSNDSPENFAGFADNRSTLTAISVEPYEVVKDTSPRDSLAHKNGKELEELININADNKEEEEESIFDKYPNYPIHDPFDAPFDY